MTDKKDAVTEEDAVQAEETTEQKATDPVDEETGEAAETTVDAQQEEELTDEEKLARRVEELEDKLLRAAAEFENYKKRMARNYENMTRTASERILRQLLEVVDSFERSLEHTNEKTDLAAFREGSELILNQMTVLLDKHDVTPIVAIGEEFDPNLHEAMMQVPSEEYDEGVVAVEICKGYRQGRHVLRHAQVGVSSGPPREQEEEK